MFNKKFLFLLISLIFLASSVSAVCIIPFLCSTEIILIDRSPDINATYGEMTAFLLGTNFINPFDSNVIDGNIVSGSFFNLFVTDNIPLVVSETGMVKIDMNFNTFTSEPRLVDMFANYNGSPSHNWKIQLWDFDTDAYIDLTADMTDFPNDPTGELTRFTFSVDNTLGDFFEDSTGKVASRIVLVSPASPNPDHNFSIDAIVIEDGALQFTTLGSFEKLTNVTEGLSRNMDVNEIGGTFTILEQGVYEGNLSLNFGGTADVAFIMAVFVDGVRQDNFFTTNSTDVEITDIKVNSANGLLDLNVGNVVDFRVAGQPGGFMTILGYDFILMRLTGVISADNQNIWETFVADTGSASADSPTDTFTILGGNNVDTTISGKTLTITVSDIPSGTNIDANIFAILEAQVPWQDANVADNITLTNITQITNRAFSDIQTRNFSLLILDDNSSFDARYVNISGDSMTGTLNNSADFNSLRLCLSDDCINAWDDVNGLMQLVPAFDVTADGNGTFGAGNYSFPDGLDVNRLDVGSTSPSLPTSTTFLQTIVTGTDSDARWRIEATGEAALDLVSTGGATQHSMQGNDYTVRNRVTNGNLTYMYTDSGGTLRNGIILDGGADFVLLSPQGDANIGIGMLTPGQLVELQGAIGTDIVVLSPMFIEFHDKGTALTNTTTPIAGLLFTTDDSSGVGAGVPRAGIEYFNNGGAGFTTKTIFFNEGSSGRVDTLTLTRENATVVGDFLVDTGDITATLGDLITTATNTSLIIGNENSNRYTFTAGNSGTFETISGQFTSIVNNRGNNGSVRSWTVKTGLNGKVNVFQVRGGNDQADEGDFVILQDGTVDGNLTAGSIQGSLNFAVQAAKLGGLASPAQIDGSQPRWYLLFDADTVECAEWQAVMPFNYLDSLVLTQKLLYQMDIATSGNVVWDINVMAVADGEDANVNSFDSVNSLTIAVPGSASTQDTANVTLDNKDSIAAGELLALSVCRNGADASDTALGDAKISGNQMLWVRSG